MASSPATNRLLVSLISAADTTLYQVADELYRRHEVDGPEDALEGLACGIVEQVRATRALLKVYAEQLMSLDQQRRR